MQADLSFRRALMFVCTLFYVAVHTHHINLKKDNAYVDSECRVLPANPDIYIYFLPFLSEKIFASVSEY